MALDLPKLTLDPDTDDVILARAKAKVTEASNGLLADFSPGSPVSALLEGQVFSVSECLWYANLLPEALALEVFRLSGVSRSLGTKAKGSLNFLLTSPLSSPFTLPQGYLVSYKDLNYVLTEALYIPSGAIEASVAIEAKTEGSDHNLPRLGFSNTSLGLNYVQSVYNLEPISGGSDLESLEDALGRAQAYIRGKDVLVSLSDYVEAAKALSGVSAFSMAPLDANKTSKTPGNVHVFLADNSGTQVATELCQAVKQSLQDRSFAGCSVWVSPADYLALSFDVVVKVSDFSDEIADSIYKALMDFLSPSKFPLGGTLDLKELEFSIRSVPGVLRQEQVLIESEALDRSMPNNYTLPTLEALQLTLVDSQGRLKGYVYGAGSDLV